MLKKIVIIVAMVVMMVTGMGMTVEAAEKNEMYDGINVEIINATHRIYLEMFVDSVAARKILNQELGTAITLPFLRYEKDGLVLCRERVGLAPNGDYVLMTADELRAFSTIRELMFYVR